MGDLKRRPVVTTSVQIHNPGNHTSAIPGTDPIPKGRFSSSDAMSEEAMYPQLVVDVNTTCPLAPTKARTR